LKLYLIMEQGTGNTIRCNVITIVDERASESLRSMFPVLASVFGCAVNYEKTVVSYRKAAMRW
jgi:hypothetical protein